MEAVGGIENRLCSGRIGGKSSYNSPHRCMTVQCFKAFFLHQRFYLFIRPIIAFQLCRRTFNVNLVTDDSMLLQRRFSICPHKLPFKIRSTMNLISHFLKDTDIVQLKLNQKPSIMRYK